MSVWSQRSRFCGFPFGAAASLEPTNKLAGAISKLSAGKPQLLTEPERPKPKKQLAPPPPPRRPIIKREAPPPPPRPSPPKKQRVATDATVDHKEFFTDDEWNLLGMEVLLAYEAAKAAYKTNVYDAVMRILNAETTLYRIETKRRKDGKSAGQQDTDVLFELHSPLHKILKKTKLRSVPDIKRAFGLP